MNEVEIQTTRHPLNLPRGSVRAMLTLAMTVIAAAVLFFGTKDMAAIFMPIFIIVVKSYFDGREKK